MSCAPVSAIAGLLLGLPGLWVDWQCLGRLRPSSAYDGLSTENCARIVGLDLGLEGSQPDTMSCTWCGRGNVVTGPLLVLM